MAVSIDRVYQRVLTLANKEQRGYIPPQEFNLLANHAQMEIFEQYFYDVKQLGRIQGNNDEYSDPLQILDEKISIFEREQDALWIQNNMPAIGFSGSLTATGANGRIIPKEIYRIGTLSIDNNQVEILNSKDFNAAAKSPLTKATPSRPLANIVGDTLFVDTGGGANFSLTVSNPTQVFLNSNWNWSIRYVAAPKKAEWAYVVINDKPLYNDNIAVDFELHPSEEVELVNKILKLAGVNLKAAEVVQVGQALEQTQIQQEKQ